MDILEFEALDFDALSDEELLHYHRKADKKAREMSYGKFIVYNTVDNDLVEKLDEKKQFLQLAIAIAMLTKSKLVDSTGTVKIWDNLIFHMAKADGFVIPPKIRNEMVDNAGGYVRDVSPGLYRWPVVFDLTSLYPSIARLLNLSPETLLREPMGGVELVDDVLSGALNPRDYVGPGTEYPDACFAVNGAIFDKSYEGIIARAMSFVFYERVRYKNLMKEEKKALEKLKEKYGPTPDAAAQLEIAAGEMAVSTWNAFQLAVKVVNNGGYGAIGNVGFRYFRPAISEAITVTGQYIIRHIADRLNIFLNGVLKTEGIDYIIGSDTDSIMVTLDGFVKLIDPAGTADKQKLVDAVNAFCEKKIEKFLEAEFNDMAEMLNARVQTLDMKREAICDFMLYRAKKNYVMRVWDMEHVRYATPQLKIAGIETRRADKPKIVRTKMEELLTVFFDGTEEQLQTEVKSFRKEFMSMPVESIAFPKGVSEVTKWTGSDGAVTLPAGAKAVPIHCRASVVYNRMLNKHPDIKGVYAPIKNKSKIKYVYLKIPNQAMDYTIAWESELPVEFDLHKHIDWDVMFEKTFANPMQSLATLVGWTITKTEKLDDLFE